MANIKIYRQCINCNHGGLSMIVYDKLWSTMKEKNITQYALIHTYRVSAGQISRIRKNANINTHTIKNMLCEILDCQPGDIMEYIK